METTTDQSDFEELNEIYDDHFGQRQNQPREDENEEQPHAEEGEDEQEARVDTDEVVNRNIQEYAASIPEEEGEESEEEEDGEIASIRRSLVTGCKCKTGCYHQFTQAQILDHILNIREMDKGEKDLYIMGTLVSNSNDSLHTRRGVRKQVHFSYRFDGRGICREVYKVIFDIGEKQLRNILKHMKTNGTVPRTHGNKGKKPHNALGFQDIKKVVQYIINFSDENGVPLPAAPHGRDDIPPVFIHSSFSKKGIHKMYMSSCEEGQRSVKYSAFVEIWKSCCQHIKIAKPQDDVCGTCEKLRKKSQDAVGEDEILEVARLMNEHISAVKRERKVYQDCIHDAREELNGVGIPDQPVSPNSSEYQNVHYTFDFAQNVLIPHHSRQVGPLYFMSPKKVQIFGVRLDGIPLQVNYLIDEHQSIGPDGANTHGPNSVISMLDHTLAQYSLGEKICKLHSDNCGGQNKNKYMMAYLAWRVMVGLNETIILMMQVAGHARCLIDSGFAHLKRLYRKTDVDTTEQLKDVVDKSAYSNKGVTYNGQDGLPAWQWREWKGFLNPVFKTLKGISSYQHFRFSSQNPGMVFVKRGADDNEVAISILKDPTHRFRDSTRPVVIPPAGMTDQRATYLYRNVRPYVRPCYRDVTCPAPGVEE